MTRKRKINRTLTRWRGVNEWWHWMATFETCKMKTDDPDCESGYSKTCVFVYKADAYMTGITSVVYDAVTKAIMSKHYMIWDTDDKKEIIKMIMKPLSEAIRIKTKIRRYSNERG